tara:strand:- start:461 stop:1480 length:1020 start_codon:yes stop_codon:yes gene_type:complete
MKYFSISIFNRGLGDNIMAYQYYKSLSVHGKTNNNYSLIYVKSELELEMSKLLNLENIHFKKIGYSPRLTILYNIKPLIDKVIFLLDILFFKKTKYLIFLDSSKNRLVKLISFFYKKSFIIGSSKFFANIFDKNIILDENLHLSDSLTHFLPPEVNIVYKLNIRNNFSSIVSENNFENYLVFAPGSGELEKHKRWPALYYSKLADLLIKTDIKIIIIGSINEKILINNILKNTSNQNIQVYIPKNLIDSLALFKYSKLVLGGDSGNLHLASIVNDNILAIWGPTNKYKTSPKTKNIKFIDLKLSCSPCYNKYRTGCGNNICLKNILPNFVFDNILQILK